MLMRQNQNACRFRKEIQTSALRQTQCGFCVRFLQKRNEKL